MAVMKNDYSWESLFGPHSLKPLFESINTTTYSHTEEKDNVLTISLAMPGIDKDKVNITLTDGKVAITYKNPDSKDYWGSKSYYYSKDISNYAGGSAIYNNGILYVTFKEKAAEKTIKVN